MTLYIDIILIENLLMNYIILFTTGIVMKRKINHVRLIIASLVGSLYAIVIYLNIVKLTSNIIMKVILSIVIIELSFAEKDYKKMFKDLLMFYLMSFIFGGCSIALIYFISPLNVKTRNGVLVGMYPIKITLIAGIVAFVIIQIAFRITKNKLSAEDMLCTVEIFIEGKNKRIKALIDSGNMLKDPISGFPVIVIEKNKIKDILPAELLDNLNIIEGGDLNNIQSKYINKIRLIPFSSLGKENGMLIGIKTEKIKITFKEKEEYIKDVIIGIYNKKLTKENTYNGLVGLELLSKT